MGERSNWTMKNRKNQFLEWLAKSTDRSDYFHLVASIEIIDSYLKKTGLVKTTFLDIEDLDDYIEFQNCLEKDKEFRSKCGFDILYVEDLNQKYNDYLKANPDLIKYSVDNTVFDKKVVVSNAVESTTKADNDLGNSYSTSGSVKSDSDKMTNSSSVFVTHSSGVHKAKQEFESSPVYNIINK